MSPADLSRLKRSSSDSDARFNKPTLCLITNGRSHCDANGTYGQSPRDFADGGKDLARSSRQWVLLPDVRIQELIQE